jgi:hypothetical protein
MKRRETRPATKDDIEAACTKYPGDGARIREFLDQIGPDDVLTYESWNSLAPLAGSAGWGYLCRKPDGTEVWCGLACVVS